MLVISLSNPDDLEPLCDFLHAVHVTAEAADDGSSVNAGVPGALSPRHERRELAGYVTTWNALNPGRDARLLD